MKIVVNAIAATLVLATSASYAGMNQTTKIDTTPPPANEALSIEQTQPISAPTNTTTTSQNKDQEKQQEKGKQVSDNQDYGNNDAPFPDQEASNTVGADDFENESMTPMMAAANPDEDLDPELLGANTISEDPIPA